MFYGTPRYLGEITSTDHEIKLEIRVGDGAGYDVKVLGGGFDYKHLVSLAMNDQIPGYSLWDGDDKSWACLESRDAAKPNIAIGAHEDGEYIAITGTINAPSDENLDFFEWEQNASFGLDEVLAVSQAIKMLRKLAA